MKGLARAPQAPGQLWRLRRLVGCTAARSTRTLGVMTKRPATVTMSVLVAVLLQSCVASNLNKYCSFSVSPSLRKADSKTLGVVLGQPGVAAIEAPYLMFYSPSMEHQEAAIRANLVAAAVPWPSALDETRCRYLDWRTYRVKLIPSNGGHSGTGRASSPLRWD